MHPVKTNATPAETRDEMAAIFRSLVFMFQIYIESAGTEAAWMHPPANFKNAGQFGASLCPPICGAFMSGFVSGKLVVRIQKKRLKTGMRR